MAQYIQRKPLMALWIAVAVVIIGRLVDLQWHLTHDEFEGTTEQIRAHFVVWIGVLMVFGVSALTVSQGVKELGYRLALAGACLYIPVAVWHFVEHANGNDPEIAHVLLGIADVAIIVGAIVATIATRRGGANLPAAGLSE